MDELGLLGRVDFDWVTRLQDVWQPDPYDVTDVHRELRDEFAEKIVGLSGKLGYASPLGWSLLGAGGSGKTHLLSAFRREAARQGLFFVLVDMTDVHRFWDTVLQGYLDSLQQAHFPDEGQHERALRRVLDRARPHARSVPELSVLQAASRDELPGLLHAVLGGLNRAAPRETIAHQDALRALACLASHDFELASLGMTWLQGQPMEETDQRALGFRAPAAASPREAITGLAWLLSWSAPTVLALDQLDPIVRQTGLQAESAEEEAEIAVARAILTEITGGLGGLRDTAPRTLSVVSCLEESWHVLEEQGLKPYLDRYETSRTLRPVRVADAAAGIVQRRLASAYDAAEFEPPYATWPFQPSAFEGLVHSTPREVLRRCHDHVGSCRARGKVSELSSFSAVPEEVVPVVHDEEAFYRRLDDRFAALLAEAEPEALLDEHAEDQELRTLLLAGLRCLVAEHDLPANITAALDAEFTATSKVPPLHARLRLVHHEEGEREDHYCARGLQRVYHSAYRSRLKGAMTQSGIDRRLKFRHLTVVRTSNPPAGNVTQVLTDGFERAGGRFVAPSDAEVRTLFALRGLLAERHEGTQRWLRARQPASRLETLRTIVPSDHFRVDGSPGPSASVPAAVPPTPDAPTTTAPDVAIERPPSVATRGADAPASDPGGIPLGRVPVDGTPQRPLSMPTALLEKHTVVLAGAGSGKTVLIRRLVEEAALRGVPSIVVDCANDLATLDEAWPEPPPSFGAEDRALAARYHAETDVVVWTPGKESGNPIVLSPLPDFGRGAEDRDDLDDLVAMAAEGLAQVAAPGNAARDRNKRGVLAKSLRHFATHGGGGLDEYIRLLDDLPPSAGLGVANEDKLAVELADSLRVEVETNPLLRHGGTPLDPAVLFGDVPGASRPRVSVVNFVGLPNLEQQRRFLHQLSMVLFSWIKRNPDPGSRPLRGLLVIDEAKDFIPSQKTSVCKDSLMRLTAQARKYHLGVVFATQNPREIENTIIGNCSTQYYGKANSPAAIATIRDQMRLKGGSGDDVPRLPRGVFYVYNADAGLESPQRVSVPLCLSRHPKDPLTEPEILAKAARSRERLS